VVTSAAGHLCWIALFTRTVVLQRSAAPIYIVSSCICSLMQIPMCVSAKRFGLGMKSQQCACRDLAEQTHKCFQAYGKCLPAPGLSSVLLVGGLDAAAQLRALKAGAEIVVGTPGRVMDFVETGKLPLSKVRSLQHRLRFATLTVACTQCIT
jgi:hypothetical protein